MALESFEYTKTWESADDFPTIETDETQVRADIQCLYDEIAAGLNRLVTALNAGGIDTAQLADGAVTTAKIDDGAVTLAKLAADVKTVFWAVYGTTTKDELDAAYAAGKEILCVYDHCVYRMSQKNTAGLYYFEMADPTQMRHRQLTFSSSNLAWNYSNYTFLPKNSPAMTGTPTAPTAAAGTNSTQVATTAFVKTALDNKVIDTDQLADGAVTNAKLAEDAVEENNIKDGAVTTQKIDDYAVTEAKLGVGAVSWSKLASGAVSLAALADNGRLVHWITYGTDNAGTIGMYLGSYNICAVKYNNRIYLPAEERLRSQGYDDDTYIFVSFDSSDGMIYWVKCATSTWTNGSVAPGSDVFVAEYGVTEYNDILAAYQAGKKIYCAADSLDLGQSGDSHFVFPLTRYDEELGPFYFALSLIYPTGVYDAPMVWEVSVTIESDPITQEQSTAWSNDRATPLNPQISGLPEPLGTAAIGTSKQLARKDHVHPLPWTPPANDGTYVLKCVKSGSSITYSWEAQT